MTRPPKVNTLLYVRVRDSETVMRSRVESSEPGRLLIALPSDGVDEHRLDPDTELTIEWIVGHGLGRVEGVVVGHTNVDVRALIVELRTEPVLQQRRDYARAELLLPVEVWPDAECREPVTGTTLDVSGGGMRALLDVDLEAGEIVRMALELPDGGTVAGLVRVIGQRDEYIAFQFHDIVPGDRERLIKAVFASHQQDASLRRKP